MLTFTIQLILAHIIGDFVLQPLKWVLHKETYKHKSKYLYWHVLVHVLALIIVLQFNFKYWLGIKIIGISILMGIYGAAWGARIPSTAALLADNVKSNDVNIASSLLWLSSILGMGIGSLFAASSTLIMPLSIILKASSISILLGSFALLFIRK